MNLTLCTLWVMKAMWQMHMLNSNWTKKIVIPTCWRLCTHFREYLRNGIFYCDENDYTFEVINMISLAWYRNKSNEFYFIYLLHMSHVKYHCTVTLKQASKVMNKYCICQLTQWQCISTNEHVFSMYKTQTSSDHLTLFIALPGFLFMINLRDFKHYSSK